MTLLARKRILAAHIETNPGEAASLVAADAACVVRDPTLVPDVPFAARDGLASLSPLAGVPGAPTGTCSFKCDLVGGGSVDPWWANLMPAAGFGVSSRVYTPRSEPPGTHVKTCTLGLYVDGTLRQLRGAAAEKLIFSFVAGQPVDVEFQFKGIYMTPSDLGVLVPSAWPTASPLRFISSALALGSWNPRVSKLTIEVANTVQLCEDSRDPSGYAYGVIAGRAVTAKMDPEASLLATKDVWAELIARTEAVLSLALGTAGNMVSFSAPKCQFTKLTPGDRGGILVHEVEAQLNRFAAGGDDELSITIG